MGGIDYRRAFNSLYASADLAFKEQLYLQATWRGDWSSALTYSDGTGDNFFNYPAVSLSWIFNETFDLPCWMSYAQLRTTISALGSYTDPFVINPGFAFNGFPNILGTYLPVTTVTDRRVRSNQLKQHPTIQK